MNSNRLTKVLDEAEPRLARLRQGSERPDPHAALARWMDDAFEIGTALVTSAALRSNARLLRYVEDAVPVLDVLAFSLASYPDFVESRFSGSWEDNEWTQLCGARSEIEFFRELFREVAPDIIEMIECRDLDEVIRARGHEGHLEDDEIPSGVPVSHWWWWYPEEPPQHR